MESCALFKCCNRTRDDSKALLCPLQTRLRSSFSPFKTISRTQRALDFASRYVLGWRGGKWYADRKFRKEQIIRYVLGWRGGKWYADRKFRKEQIIPKRWQLKFFR